MTENKVDVVDTVRNKTGALTMVLQESVDEGVQALYAIETHLGVMNKAITDQEDPSVIAEFFLKVWDNIDIMDSNLKSLADHIKRIKNNMPKLSEALEDYFKEKLEETK